MVKLADYWSRARSVSSAVWLRPASSQYSTANSFQLIFKCYHKRNFKRLILSPRDIAFPCDTFVSEKLCESDFSFRICIHKLVRNPNLVNFILELQESQMGLTTLHSHYWGCQFQGAKVVILWWSGDGYRKNAIGQSYCQEKTGDKTWKLNNRGPHRTSKA